MPRTLFTIAALLFVTGFSSTASANDIVDFLRAINGVPDHRDRHHHRDDYRARDRSRNIHRVGYRHTDSYRGRHSHRVQTPRRVGNRYVNQRRTRPLALGSSRFSVSLNLGNSPQVLPPPPVWVPPVPVVVEPLHHWGEIVTCPVTLEPHVVVKDACQVAPGAIPVVIAVRDPHLGRYGRRDCQERLVYVEVLVPPCPLQRVRVSPCKTKIRLDYGEYEVDIISRNGVVVIDYDN